MVSPHFSPETCEPNPIFCDLGHIVSLGVLLEWSVVSPAEAFLLGTCMRLDELVFV